MTALSPKKSATARPTIFGIVNITVDSFSDGGRYLDPRAAIEQSLRLLAQGADVIDLGAAASNTAAAPVDTALEIARLDPVITALEAHGAMISIDTFRLETQRYAIARAVAFLNDIEGFANPSLYPLLASSRARLVIMHSVQGRGRAQGMDIGAQEIWRRIETFFDARLRALEEAGIARERMILDPGMGFFLSVRAEASLSVLASLYRLKERYRLPVLVSVSRKSFLRAVTGRDEVSALGAATLAAELCAAGAGADFIRTHDPAALRDGLEVWEAIEAAKG
jgi:dihydropteroate synthase type 2